MLRECRRLLRAAFQEWHGFEVDTQGDAFFGDRELAAACLEGYGEVLVAQGKAKSAVQLWWIAAAVRAEIVAPIPPIYRPDYIQAVAVARKSLDEEAFQMAWTKGSHTSLDHVFLTP